MIFANIISNTTIPERSASKIKRSQRIVKYFYRL